jgi:hypothetical protein
MTATQPGRPELAWRGRQGGQEKADREEDGGSLTTAKEEIRGLTWRCLGRCSTWLCNVGVKIGRGLVEERVIEDVGTLGAS